MSEAVGICVGAVTLSLAEGVDGRIAYKSVSHDGKVAEALQSVLRDRPGARVGITGQKYRKSVPYPTIAEPQAVELAFGHIRDRYPDIDTIVSAGGESFLAYSLDRSGRVRSVHTGNKCAAGTGEFFLQQVRRMGLTLEEAVEIAAVEEPYLVASRCSVFCKSDCTHAMNKGIGRGRIGAGLCRMLSGKITELLKAARAQRVLLVGGVSRNSLVMDHVRTAFPETFIPEEADCFEALGAYLWVRSNGVRPVAPGENAAVLPTSFPSLPPLGSGQSKVRFIGGSRGEYYQGEYVLGLDVGSTTTKAVLVRADTRAIVSDVYIRTDGDPVGASRRCYSQLYQLLPDGHSPVIVGLGVTGSGRQIAGLHALTEGIFNEIVAHAHAAVHHDPEVDTIFEIGGQDAKYTFLAGGIPVDYAMNEACSAGTGSFLEESCSESLGLDVDSIADTALKGPAPPDFSDQCSAFIGSDIKIAIHEGVSRPDIAAGLVYSVCRNYLNRVRGSRRTGKRVFMQGGVCYNRAVPLAMANLCRTHIIVPPDPGLMGAFGAALMSLDRIEKGTVGKRSFDLQELSLRQVRMLDSFVCKGGREKCDRKCTIARYRVNGHIYPFGGSCDRYYNRRQDQTAARQSMDLVSRREALLSGNGLAAAVDGNSRKIGIPVSLMTNSYYSLYERFFTGLGMEVVKGEKADAEGVEEAGSTLCYPVLMSHGYVKDLLNQDVDHIFIPHVRDLPAPDGSGGTSCTCPLVQGEPYILGAAFHSELSDKLVTEVFDLRDHGKALESFTRLGSKLGFSRRQVAAAFDSAWADLGKTGDRLAETGRDFLAELKEGEPALVLFGRPYNALTRRGNMGVPGKFTSRGYRIIPYDMLPMEKDLKPPQERMYWASGKGILGAAGVVRDTPDLYGVFITSFSCGPDSFILENFRSIMGNKPYLVLELDAHTADAGVDTRIEAFLDVVRGVTNGSRSSTQAAQTTAARLIMENGGLTVQKSGGEKVSMADPGVQVLVPSMGQISARGMAAAMNYTGIKATAAPAPGRKELELGKHNASCKECLPYLLTAGSLKLCAENREDDDEVLLYFLPEADGPCRFGLYGQALRNIVEREGLTNVAILSPSSNNGYAGFPSDFNRRGLLSIAITDGLADIRAAILTLARDQDKAMRLYSKVEDSVIESLAADPDKKVLDVLGEGMSRLSTLPLTGSLEDVTKILLTGEIYVRRDGFSSYNLTDRLAREGVWVTTSPILEWLFYIDHIVITGLLNRASLKERFLLWLRNRYCRRMADRVQSTLALSGFYEKHDLDMGFLVDKGRQLMDPRLTGEAILTVSSTMSEIGDSVHGVISVSPFGCMPGRIAESIINNRLEKDKYLFSRRNGEFWKKHQDKLPLPFLALETDGNPMSQMIETKLDSFIMGAHRLKKELKELNFTNGKS